MSPLQGIILVAGIPGVGKTTFIQQLKEASSSSYHWIVWAYDELVTFNELFRSSSGPYRRYLYQWLEHALLIDNEDDFMNHPSNNHKNDHSSNMYMERFPDDPLFNRQLIEERLQELKNSK
jgi:hypothetical protein